MAPRSRRPAAAGPPSPLIAVSLGLDVAEVNADGTRTLPMPTAVVLDAAGVIRWIDVHPDYTTRSEVGQILRAVEAAAALG